ncbi:MAG TPA: RpiB/LacA/LacB family sugar-phosphate isomerase [Candidatus Eisenbacteria bacterium]|nr:RpiB/LacA/LacB family sugar-phosphate isomerase [Candidatus Eisenbacteria bacterium]
MTARKPTVHLGTDHAGLALKNAVKAYLVRLRYHVHDAGAFDGSPSDYPDFIIPAAEAAARSRGSAVAIVFGGSGIGECIAANKVRGARAALVYDRYTARMSREHNDANVLCLGSRTVTKDFALAKRLVKVWLETRFSGDVRHVRRLKKIASYEKR